MVSHAWWRTWPSGPCNDKQSLRSRFLSTESLGHVFRTAWEIIIKSFNICIEIYTRFRYVSWCCDFILLWNLNECIWIYHLYSSWLFSRHWDNLDGLVRGKHKSSALSMGVRISCTSISISCLHQCEWSYCENMGNTIEHQITLKCGQ